jgi:hypothetical protein
MTELISRIVETNSFNNQIREEALEELEELVQISIDSLEKKKLLSNNLFRPIDFFSANVRPSLVNHVKSKESYGFFNHPVIQAPTSEDEREIEDLEISVRQVADFLFDFQTIRIIDVIFTNLAGR